MNDILYGCLIASITFLVVAIAVNASVDSWANWEKYLRWKECY